MRIGIRTSFSESIHRAANARRSTIEDMEMDHRRLDAAVAQKVQDGSEVIAVFEQVGGEGMPGRCGRWPAWSSQPSPPRAAGLSERAIPPRDGVLVPLKDYHHHVTDRGIVRKVSIDPGENPHLRIWVLFWVWRRRSPRGALSARRLVSYR